jgi:hypothetical protein
MKQEIMIRLAVLKTYYKDFNLTEKGFEMWAEDLIDEGFTIENIATGIREYRKHEVYAPTLAGIINYIPKPNISEIMIQACRMTLEKGTEYARKHLGEAGATQLRANYQRLGYTEDETSRRMYLKEIENQLRTNKVFNENYQDYILQLENEENEQVLLEMEG